MSNATDFFKGSDIERLCGEKAALYYNDLTFNYNELNGMINRYSNFFLSICSGSRERVGILLKDSPQFIFLFFGAIGAGIIPVVINTKYSTEEIGYIIEDSKISTLFTEPMQKQRLEKEGRLGHSLKIIDLYDKGQNDFEKQLDSCESAFNVQYTAADDEECFVLYTSGSSGRPKGVIHKTLSMAACSANFGSSVLGLKESDIIYSVSKMAHSYGLGNTTFLTFGAGAASVISRGENVFEVLENIKRFRPTVFFAVPTVYAAIISISDVEKVDLSSIRLFVSAGETLSASLWQKWKDRFNSEILNGFGTTELLTAAISNRVGEGKPGSAGVAVPGFDLKIVDGLNHLVNDGVVGDLLVSGDSLMKGYLYNTEKSGSDFIDSYLKTGDKFFRDSDGYYWYAGRVTDSFKVNGRWVKAQDIEEILLELPEVEALFVNGDFGHNDVTVITAYIKPASHIQPSETLVRKFKCYLKSRLEHFKCPRRFHFLSELPKGPTGKIKRGELDSKLIVMSF